jgi:opacity protein-like surface antigen
MTKKLLLSAIAFFAVNSYTFADEYYSNYNSDAGTSYLQQQHFGTGFYAGLAYGYTSVEDDYYEYFPTAGLSVQTDIDYNALLFQGGYQYNPYIAFEFRYWMSFGDGDYSISSNYPPLYPTPAGSYADFDAWGLYLKPMYPISNELSVYALLGLSGVSVTGEPGWDLLDDNDFSWGVGASYAITPNILLFADYANLYDGTIDYYGFDSESTQDSSADTINVGVSYRF